MRMPIQAAIYESNIVRSINNPINCEAESNKNNPEDIPQTIETEISNGDMREDTCVPTERHIQNDQIFARYLRPKSISNKPISIHSTT